MQATTPSAATALVEGARAAVFRHFRAAESEYECVFTANASGAMRLVGEAYPFAPAGRFLATADNHNSVNGIREFARAKGARTAYVALVTPDLRVDDGVLLGIPAIEIGLRHLERIGIDAIALRVEALGTRLLAELGRLPHAGGEPAARIYGPATWDGRGATIALNFLHPDGRVVDERFVDALAAEHDIWLRTGCFCNPGAGEAAFGISRDALADAEFGDDTILDDFIAHIGMPSGGAVRVSLGIASNAADVHRFLLLAREFVDLDEVPEGLPPRLAC
jgi:selenocysteine lyase/cysteine desulfurase